MSDTPELAAALVAAQASAKGLHHDQRTSFGPQYNYTSTESLILEAQKHLSANGLAFVCTVSKLSEFGVAQAVAKLSMVYTLTHSGGQSQLYEQEWPVCPGKGRPMDKAVAAADTASLGYMLRGLLLMARVEKGTDLNDHREPDPPKQEQRREEQPQREQAPPTAREKLQTWGQRVLGVHYADLDAFAADQWPNRPPLEEWPAEQLREVCINLGKTDHDWRYWFDDFNNREKTA